MRKSLNNLIELSSKVAIYVPSTIDVNKTTDNTDATNCTLSFLSKLFGGATATKALGSWVCDDGSLIKESVVVCYSFTNSETLEKSIEEVIEYCEDLRNTLRQEAISLEVNNKLYFI